MQKKAIGLLPESEQARWADNYRLCLQLFESQRPYEWKHFGNLPDRDLLCWWKFDDPEGDIFRDRAGRGHDLKLAGDVRSIAGNDGVRFQFYGQGSVQCAGAAELDTPDVLSVVAWIHYLPLEGAAESWQQIAGKGDAWGLQTDARHMAVFACSELRMPSSKLSSDVTGKTSLDDGRWHFVVGVYDGQGLSLYLDGRLEDRITASGRLIACPDGISLAAERRDAYPWQGLIREIRVYSRALTSEEVAYLYEATMR